MKLTRGDIEKQRAERRQRADELGQKVAREINEARFWGNSEFPDDTSPLMKYLFFVIVACAIIEYILLCLFIIFNV